MDLRVRRERLMTAIVWRLPRWVIKWAVVRAAVKDRNEYPGDAKASEMVTQWSERP